MTPKSDPQIGDHDLVGESHTLVKTLIATTTDIFAATRAQILEPST